jgi:hypothetical protein
MRIFEREGRLDGEEKLTAAADSPRKVSLASA